MIAAIGASGTAAVATVMEHPAMQLQWCAPSWDGTPF
jgi:hypothetical protein